MGSASTPGARGGKAPSPPSTGSPAAPTRILQRRCACGQHTAGGGDCEGCRRGGGASLQRSAVGWGAAKGPASLVDDVLRSAGEPLDRATRAEMEPKLGLDFSRVRVHSSGRAAESARAVNAHAYTVGQDVVFDRGRYQPSTSEGKRLLAHELTHVAQQARGPVSGRPGPGGLLVSQPGDSFEREAEQNASRISAASPTSTAKPGPVPTPTAGPEAGRTIQREADPSSSSSPPAGGDLLPATSGGAGPTFGDALELPGDRAAILVNQALDVMGSVLTYVRRPPMPSQLVASADGPSPGPAPAGNQADSPSADAVLQTSPASVIQREGSGPPASFLAKVHGGVVGSMEVCWDCLTGEASVKGWIWAGVGYEAPVIGWVGGYFFGEQTWWKGQLARLFDPGQCAPNCDPSKSVDTEFAGGIAGFPIDIKPKQRARFSRGGLEAGFLLTPHSFCDADLELIALLDLLGYLGPVATVATKAVDGLNALTRNRLHFELQAGVDLSATLHLCRGANGALAINRADFCGGGFVGAGIGLSHDKGENHGGG